MAQDGTVYPNEAENWQEGVAQVPEQGAEQDMSARNVQRAQVRRAKDERRSREQAAQQQSRVRENSIKVGKNATGTAMQAGGTIVQGVGKATRTTGKVVTRAGVALSSTGVGAVAGVPLAIAGAGLTAGGTGLDAAGKTTRRVGRVVKKSGTRKTRFPRSRTVSGDFKNKKSLRARTLSGEGRKVSIRQGSVSYAADPATMALNSVGNTFNAIMGFVKNSLEKVVFWPLLLPMTIFMSLWLFWINIMTLGLFAASVETDVLIRGGVTMAASAWVGDGALAEAAGWTAANVLTLFGLIDISDLFVAEMWGMFAWTISLLFTAIGFGFIWFVYLTFGRSFSRYPEGFAITLTCFVCAVIPFINLLPWLVIWTVYLHLRKN